MPIHEYECKVCNTVTERFFKTYDAVQKTVDCWNCGFTAGKRISRCNIGPSYTSSSSEHYLGEMQALHCNAAMEIHDDGSVTMHNTKVKGLDIIPTIDRKGKLN